MCDNNMNVIANGEVMLAFVWIIKCPAALRGSEWTRVKSKHRAIRQDKLVVTLIKKNDSCVLLLIK